MHANPQLNVISTTDLSLMLLQAFFEMCLLRTEFSQILQVHQGYTLDVLVLWGLLIVIGNAL